MKKLCFGSYATVLTFCKAKSVSQKRLCGTLLLSVASTYDICDDDGTTSDLVHGKKNLSANVTEIAPLANARSASNYFKQNVLPLLDHNNRSHIILAIKDILISDDSIKPDTVVERVNGMTKVNIATRDAFVLEDFLAGIFLYVAVNVENRNCEEYVNEITKEYLQSFDAQQTNITFLTAYAKFNLETANEIAIDSHSLALLTETGGKCQKCGRPLGIKKEGNDVNYAKVVHLSKTDDVVLCVECEREILSASETDKMALISDQHNLRTRVAAREATSRYVLEKKIEEVLREIHLMDASDDTHLKIDPIKVERKITEKRLKDRVLFDVRQLYEGVNSSLDRLAGENKLNVDKFAKNIRRMYEDAGEILTSQSDIYNLLVETLFEKTGRKYREACEIIISYFVQRCEVFDEIAE